MLSELFKDPAWLEENFVVLNKSVKDIANECQTSEYEVNFYLEMYGLQIQD